MIPVSLKISGFLSYREPVAIQFTSFDLAAISGANGAGKSSLLDAITWALFGQARRRDDAVINSASEAAEVIFEFEYEGQQYRVQRTKVRNKTTMLEFAICDSDGRWRALTEHSLRETEARIEQILRMNYETFTNASFFLQGKADQFAQQRPGDRKRILSSILGLEVWDAYREEAQARRKQAEVLLLNIDGQLREIDAELQQETSRRSRLEQLQSELEKQLELVRVQQSALDSYYKLANSVEEQGRHVESLARQLASDRSQLEHLNQKATERRLEQQQYQQHIQQAAQIEAAYRAWQDSRVKLEHWESLAANFRQQEQERSAPLMAIEADKARLLEEQRSCLTQLSQSESQRAMLPQVTLQVSESQAQIQTLELRREQLRQLQEEQQVLAQTQAGANAENTRLKLEMAQLKERIDQLYEATGVVCPTCGQPLSPDERAKLIKDLEAQGKTQGDQYRSNQAAVDKGLQRQKEITQQLSGQRQLETDLRQAEQRLTQALSRQEQIQESLAAWEAGGLVRLNEINRILEAGDYAHAAREELNRINLALKAIGYDAAAHDAVRREEQAGRASENHIRQLHEARAALQPLEREIAGLEEQIRTANDAILLRENEYNQAAERYADEKASLPDIQQAESDLYSLKQRENQLRMDVGGANQAVEVLKSLRKRQKELNSEKSEHTRKITRLKTLEHAFSKDGIPALLIEQALPEIEGQANDILQRLSDGTMSVRFDTQRDYKDKSREDKKETLDIIISDPSGPREYELFSGGEAFRVNFAIRLAMSKVLAQRSGARLQTLVIDEGFGSQDVEGRQRLIEAINLVSPDFRKVLVITHLEELKDVFPARIEVEKTPTGSRVRVVAQ